MPIKLTVRKPEDFIEFPLDAIFQGIHQRIEQQVSLYRGKTAIATYDLKYSYAEMNGRANSLAHAILDTKGTRLGQVAILQSISPDLIISLLASLKAHKAYVPLDFHFPMERLRAMMRDSEAEIILTDRAHASMAEELCADGAEILVVEEVDYSVDLPNPNVACDPMDRAYILYTSGTTGKPKGIEFLHRNLLHTTMCLTNELFYSPSDRVSWLHSPSFAASIVDIYNCLTNGGTLFPWDAKSQGFNGMFRWVTDNRLTAFHWVPSAFRQFMRTVPERAVFNDVRIAVMAGEALTTSEVELFRRFFPVGSYLVNQVGTAESYNYYLYPLDHQTPVEPPNVPGGYPVSPDRKLLILDESHEELPGGSVGEIAIKSNFMAAGYWHNGELTRSKFVRLGSDETPVYLTGDLGKIDEGGCLHHFGRKDFQFKIRGCRVELSEVDHRLLSAPGVQDAITWVVKNRRGEDQLVGYVVPRNGNIDQKAIEDHLAQTLPTYMVPRCYVVMDALPMLPTGKSDRKSLPNPFVDEKVQVESANQDLQDAGERIVAIFKGLLQSDAINLDSDFMEEGGDSLLSAVLLHKIQEKFGVEIDPDDLLDAPTPRGLVKLIEGDHRNKGRSQTQSPGERTTESSSPGPRFHQRRKWDWGTNGSIVSSVAQRLIIIGAGQYGREIFTWAAQSIADGSRFSIKGFLDDRRGALDGYNYDVGVLGTVEDYEIEPGDVFVGAIGNPVAKAKCCTRIYEKGGRFINIIHPLANIGKNVELGTGIVLAPFTSITVDVTLGHHVAIGAFSNIGHDTVVGDFAQISSHCGLNGTASLGEGAFLGSHACILPGVKVGAWAYVGAGSVVVRDIEECTKVFGNPAAVIGRSEAWKDVGELAQPATEAVSAETAQKR